MAGLFGSLGTATKGLNAQQAAMQTTSHNLANANTVGYSRQRVNLQADSPYHMGGIGELGTGVKVSSVVRIVDDYLIGQVRNETSAYRFYEQKSETLGQLEIIFNEPSTSGLTANLNKYFEAWTSLGSNSSLNNARTIVVENGKTLTDTLNHLSSQMTDLSDDTLSEIEKSALDFNGRIKQLDTLNKQIFNVTSQGSVPNDLLDQRDAILSGLSEYSSVGVTIDKFGRAAVKIDNQDVLTNTSVKTLSVVTGTDIQGRALVSKNGDPLKEKVPVEGNFNKGAILLTDESGDEVSYTAITVKSGKIKGLQESLSEVRDRLKELDQFAYSLAKAVNLVHSNNGESIDFFEGPDTAENYASKIKVNSEIRQDPSKINVGKTLNQPESGDGSRATAIAKLRNLKLKYPVDTTSLQFDVEKMEITPQEGGLTFAGAYVDMVTKNGISKQQADQTMASQESLLTLLEQRKDSVSGVSINEEVTDVIRFQRAFEANSKVISVISEMLDTLINRTGV